MILRIMLLNSTFCKDMTSFTRPEHQAQSLDIVCPLYFNFFRPCYSSLSSLSFSSGTILVSAGFPHHLSCYMSPFLKFFLSAPLLEPTTSSLVSMPCARYTPFICTTLPIFSKTLIPTRGVCNHPGISSTHPSLCQLQEGAWSLRCTRRVPTGYKFYHPYLPYAAWHQYLPRAIRSPDGEYGTGEGNKDGRERI